MPEAEVEKTFDSPLAKVWQTINDLTKIGNCHRFVERVEASPRGDVRWIIKSPMSKVTRTAHVEASFANMREKQSLSWKAEGEHLLWTGEITLEPLSKQTTKAKFKLKVQGQGPLALLINQLAGAQVKGNLDFFVEEIRKKLED